MEREFPALFDLVNDETVRSEFDPDAYYRKIFNLFCETHKKYYTTPIEEDASFQQAISILESM